MVSLRLAVCRSLGLYSHRRHPPPCKPVNYVQPRPHTNRHTHRNRIFRVAEDKWDHCAYDCPHTLETIIILLAIGSLTAFDPEQNYTNSVFINIIIRSGAKCSITKTLTKLKRPHFLVHPVYIRMSFTYIAYCLLFSFILMFFYSFVLCSVRRITVCTFVSRRYYSKDFLAGFSFAFTRQFWLCIVRRLTRVVWGRKTQP